MDTNEDTIRSLKAERAGFDQAGDKEGVRQCDRLLKLLEPQKSDKK